MTRLRRTRAIPKWLDRNTEAALRQAVKKLPHEVYVSPQFRESKERLHIISVTVPTAKENFERALNADPMGFLIATMNGQPLPEWVVAVHEDGTATVGVKYVTPDLPSRMVAARYLTMVQNRLSPDKDEGNQFNAKMREAARKQRELEEGKD